MCYSAQIEAAYWTYLRQFGAHIDFDAFLRLYEARESGAAVKTPRAMDLAFLASDGGGVESRIRALIRAHDARSVQRLEQEVFQQRRRLADAERRLQVRVTKAAQESQRIARGKTERALARLADLRRGAAVDRDARIFPMVYAPVMVWAEGRRVVRPMRYQCRPAGKPASWDQRYPGTYNARRDNLEGYWRGQFGHTHGLMLVEAFYEHVARHAAEGRALREGETEESVVLEFRPSPPQPMLVACLWSHWTGPGDDVLSFAAITDTPPPEVAAAGHDRCIIPIDPVNIDRWLRPDPARLGDAYAVLDARIRPYYAHRMAA